MKELSHLSRSEKARVCGYEYESKSGKSRTDLSAFLEAILQAEGLQVNPDSSPGRGRVPTYRVTVHTNGQIVIGKVYTEMMGVQPGDVFEIKLGYKHIHLSHLGADESEEQDE